MNTNQPFIIGVAGGSGSGKTTIVENLSQTLKSEDVVCISHDDYYRDQSHLPMSKRVKTNYDHPQALETKLLITHLKKLIAGREFEKPTYDFVHHTRAKKTETIEPHKVVFIEGILILESAKLRELMNLKIFVSTDADLRVMRRIQRDIEQRGRTFEQVIDQYLKTTRPMHLEFVEPSKRYADVIIPEGGENPAVLDLLAARVKEQL